MIKEFKTIPPHPLVSLSTTPTSIILHLDSCPNTETSNSLASLLYYQSIPASVGHIKSYAVILTDTTDLKERIRCCIIM